MNCEAGPRRSHQATGLFADNQFSKAIPLLREAATLAPKEPVIHRYLGYALWKEDHLKETAHELEEALHLHSKDVFTLYFLADGRFQFDRVWRARIVGQKRRSRNVRTALKRSLDGLESLGSASNKTS